MFTHSAQLGPACLIMDYERQTWSDWTFKNCYESHGFICEFPPEVESTSNVTCVHGTCYHFVQEELSRDEAEAYCRDKLDGEMVQGNMEERSRTHLEQLLREKLYGLEEVFSNDAGIYTESSNQ